MTAMTGSSPDPGLSHHGGVQAQAAGPYPRAVSYPPALRLTPSTRVLWRGHDEVQLELGDRAVVVGGSASHLVERLNRSPTDPVHPAAADHPAAAAEAGTSTLGRVLDTLTRAGFLIPAVPPTPTPAPTSQPAVSAAVALLAPDLAAGAARFGAHVADVFQARRAWRVTVQGAGRLPTLIASLFAAAGVGHVSIAQGGDVGLGDALPGGLQPSDEGRRTGLAGPDAIRRAAPGVDTALSWRPANDLTVLAVDGPVKASIHRCLTADEQAHLVTTVWGAGAVVGPLVVPGRTSCLGCADLHRADRDPAWPALVAQLTTASPAAHSPSDVAVCVLAAALTVVQGLAFLDGEQPATIDGTLETTLPDWRLRRRSWPAHPDCPCAGAGASRHTGLRE